MIARVSHLSHKRSQWANNCQQKLFSLSLIVIEQTACNDLYEPVSESLTSATSFHLIYTVIQAGAILQYDVQK